MKVGIDFGTSTSEIAYLDQDARLVMVANHLGEVITPSVVYIQEDGTPLVGVEAQEQVLLDPDNGFIEVKRLLGKETTLTARGKTYRPVDIAQMIIAYLVDCAQQQSGQMIDSAVITVPAYFTDAQRRQVMDAGALAGLQVDRIINEPTAASLDYGLQNMEQCSHVLVYDLGGGTLDVTVLELFEGVVDVKSSTGNNALGGADFDQALIDYMISRLDTKAQTAVKKDPRAMMRLKMAAIACKIALSIQSEYTVELPFLYTISGKPKAYEETISRELFEQMILPTVTATKKQINDALFDAELATENIDMVLLVGGSTRIPLIKNMLETLFGHTPTSSVDPDLAVVRGAAIQAGVLAGILKENAIFLTDVCPYSLSTATLRNVRTSFGLDEELFCDVLIPRNTTLPASVSKMYATSQDNQQVVHVSAYQGESEVPEENTLLNKFVLSGIPKGRAGKESIKIQFAYDLNGILHIEATVVSTGKSISATASTTDTVDLASWKQAPLAKRHRNLLNKAERVRKLHLSEPEATEEEIEDLITAMNTLKRALVMDWEFDICEDLAEDLSDVLEDFA